MQRGLCRAASPSSCAQLCRPVRKAGHSERTLLSRMAVTAFAGGLLDLFLLCHPHRRRPPFPLPPPASSFPGPGPGWGCLRAQHWATVVLGAQGVPLASHLCLFWFSPVPKNFSCHHVDPEAIVPRRVHSWASVCLAQVLGCVGLRRAGGSDDRIIMPLEGGREAACRSGSCL